MQSFCFDKIKSIKNKFIYGREFLWNILLLRLYYLYLFLCYCYGKYRYLFNINYKISFVVYNIIIIFIVTSFYYIKGIEDTSKYIDKYQVAVETLKNGIYTDEELNDIETTFFIIDNELYSHIE